MLKFLEKNKNITDLSNFKTKAISKYYYEINNITDLDKLKDIFSFAKQNNLKTLFVWWWTNLLFAFDIYEWIIIKNNLIWWKYIKNTKILESYTNELISDISKSLLKDYWQNLFKRFIWLPWTLGGAIYWNAGCFWLEISNNFLEATIFNLDTFQLEVFSKEDMKFWYRTSFIKNKPKFFVVSAKFDLSNIIEKYSNWKIDIEDFRENKQPKWNSCGSFFKNPSKDLSAWYIIEKIWFKWYNLNWAYFSELHSNFLINDWTATYKNLLKLIELTKQKTKKEFNLELEPEVNIIYN